MVILLLCVLPIAILALVTLGIIRAKLCECTENPIRKAVFYTLIAAQYAAAVAVVCIQVLRPYRLHTSYRDVYWNVNEQIYWLLGAMYVLSLLTAFNYEKLDDRLRFRRIMVYVSVSAVIILVGQWANQELFSKVETFNGSQYLAYTHKRVVADFIIALIPLFLVFYCYVRRLFFRDMNLYKQLFYSVLPVLLFYALSSYIQIRFELMSMEERDKIGHEIGAFG